jgi:microcystin-dependent protein
MSSPFIGEIRMFAGNFAPQGWAFCNGALMAIDQNAALFQLIGTTYGGDGQSTFALPDLQSRIPVHVGPGFPLAQRAGVETVTLTAGQIPAHQHVMSVSNAAGIQPGPGGNVLAASTTVKLYNALNPPNQPLNAGSIASAGGSQPHDNMQPFLVINFILSLFGVFPSQN